MSHALRAISSHPRRTRKQAQVELTNKMQTKTRKAMGRHETIFMASTPKGKINTMEMSPKMQTELEERVEKHRQARLTRIVIVMIPTKLVFLARIGGHILGNADLADYTMHRSREKSITFKKCGSLRCARDAATMRPLVFSSRHQRGSKRRLYVTDMWSNTFPRLVEDSLQTLRIIGYV